MGRINLLPNHFDDNKGQIFPGFHLFSPTVAIRFEQTEGRILHKTLKQCI